MALSALLSGTQLKQATTVSLAGQTGLAIVRRRPKRAALLGVATLVSTKSTLGGVAMQGLAELTDRR
jgi:hypothetical protein